MRSLVIFGFLIMCFSGRSQPYNQLWKVSTGVSYEQFDHLRIKNAINDTGAVQLDFLSWSPTISYSHEFILGEVISVGGTVGFQYMNLYYGPQHYGAPYFYISANPQLTLLHRKNFEYYMKLQIGGTFYLNDTEVIPEPVSRLLPSTANLYTGVTLGGFNFFLTDHLGLNLELSIWSPELATFGLTYRFFKGELPEIQNNGAPETDENKNKIEKKNDDNQDF